jgi:hypothetical protein
VTQKQIVAAQKILRRLDKTPIKLMRADGKVCFQVTYESDMYNDLLNIIETVADTPLYNQTTFDTPINYHREKV